MKLVANASDQFVVVPLDTEHPLFMLYTSGTTGKPKGVDFSILAKLREEEE